jgi:AraC-like DNA-binding protein
LKNQWQAKQDFPGKGFFGILGQTGSMNYLKYKPCSQLAPFIECYFIWENDQLPEEPLIIESPPSGFASIVFNYRDPYFLSNSKYRLLQVPQNFIAGQNIYAYTLTLPGIIGLAGIVFRPAAIATMFGLAMYEFVEERVELGKIFPPAVIDRYTSDFQSASTLDGKAALLEQFVLENTDTSRMTPDYIDIAANQIIDLKGQVKLNELIQNSFTTRRTFERNFFQKVGLSPKFYSRIARISYICNLIAGKKEVDWPRVYLENEFYDHSHFIRDFEEIIGRPPGQYLKENRELVHHVGKPSISPLSGSDLRGL